MLVKNKVIELALKLDTLLLEQLLSNEMLRNCFFTAVKDTFVFDKIKFQRFVGSKNFLPDSYTQYKNKIGLSSEGDYLSEKSSVVLSYPYKDCVLEGGQSKEEHGRSEIFWNQLLAPDECDRLLSPKAFNNFQQLSSEEMRIPSQVSIQDNFLIKGNNLLVLKSLLPAYAGKVKLIYIDPPYNTKGNKFEYNDNFNHSSWLTFIKNRLEVARDLLANDGVILVHCDDAEQAYLKVLMDEIFGRQNFIETFIWRNTDNPPSLSKKSRSSVEFIIAFEKHINTSVPYIGKDTENDDTPLLNRGNSPKDLTFPKGTIHFNLPDGLINKGQYDRVIVKNDFSIKDGKNQEDVTLYGEFRWKQESLNHEVSNGTYFLVKSDKFSIRFQKPSATSMAPEKCFDEVYLSKSIGVGSNEDATSHLSKIGINFTTSKPESVVAFFIRAITKPGELVLDFFAGSGTTAAVAHKMGRRWISVEQMNYIEDVTKARLEKVIEGEQGGISKAVNWRGGGSFVYCELATYNQKYVDAIQLASEGSDLYKIWEEMKKSSLLSYKVDPKQIDRTKDSFEKLSLKDQKRFLIETLEANMLYVPRSEIEDDTYGISDQDKALNKQLFG